MSDSYEEQIAEDLPVDDESPSDDAETVITPDRCPSCGKYAQIAETRLRKRGTLIVEVLDCGHRQERHG